MKIRTKLITAFSIPFLIINGISASLISMQTTGRMQAQEIRNIEHAFSFIERELAFYDDSLSTSTDSAATMYMEESAASRNDEIREEWLLNTLKVNLQNIQKKLSVFGAVHVIHSDGTVLYSSVSDPPEDLIKLAAAQTAAEDESSGKKSGAVTVSRKYRENEEEYIFAASLSSSDRYLIIEMNKNELYADRRSFSFFMLVNVAAAELILILIFIFITGKFVTPITHVTKRFQVLARGRGDLSVRIPVKGKDETSDLANAFNTFSNKLREIIVSLKDQITFNSLTMGQFDTNIEKTVNQLGNMNDAVSEIDNEMKQIISRIQESFSAASEINKSADTIQQKAFGQNAAVEQSSASIEELIAAINNLASVADSRMKVIEDLNNSARKGQDRMNDTENSIAKISDSAGIIQELITVIDNIAQNTNLLAMNAAIEAAHAGEAGKGFSVVADEIRKLAENTQENSHNITENINSILETISSTQDVTKITGQAIDEIVDDVKNVYEGIKEIQSGLNEMASGTQEITSSIHMLSETSGALSDSTVDIHDKTGIIEQTLSSVSELAANTEKTVEAFMQSAKHVLELTRQMNKMGQNAVDNAGRMNDSVKQFKT